MKHPVFKFLMNALGVVSVGLGVLGIFLPLLPTTPLLLLAAFCFARGSDRMYGWLVSHRIFGSYIRSYREYNAVTIQTKIIAIALLWVAIGSSVVFFLESESLRVTLLLIATGVTVYLVSLKTLTEDLKEQAHRKPSRAKKRKRR
ncbi:YbaN family protein [bacterium]|nr:YbaN family protein [bacterium]